MRKAYDPYLLLGSICDEMNALKTETIELVFK